MMKHQGWGTTRVSRCSNFRALVPTVLEFCLACELVGLTGAFETSSRARITRTEITALMRSYNFSTHYA